MSPPKARWMPPTNCRLSSHSRVRHGQQLLGGGVDQADAVAVLAVDLAAGVHDEQLAQVVGEHQRCTVRAPLTPMPPVRLLTKPVSTAPVVPFTAARRDASDAVDLVKRPPT